MMLWSQPDVVLDVIRKAAATVHKTEGANALLAQRTRSDQREADRDPDDTDPLRQGFLLLHRGGQVADLDDLRVMGEIEGTGECKGARATSRMPARMRPRRMGIPGS